VPIKSFFDELDKWVRRRIRMCIWESWKNGRTRAAALMKLGVPEHEAFTHGMSSKGPWVLSSSQAVHQALPVALYAVNPSASSRLIFLARAFCSRVARTISGAPGGGSYFLRG